MELEEQLNEILSDPARMEQIMQLAQSLIGDSESNGEVTPPTQLLQMLQRMQIPDGDASKQAALLDALKPFVTPTHKKRLEKALRLSRLSQMAGLALQELEQDNSV